MGKCCAGCRHESFINIIFIQRSRIIHADEGLRFPFVVAADDDQVYILHRCSSVDNVEAVR